jgi:hypothetical protein
MGIKRALGLDREPEFKFNYAVQNSYSELPSMPYEAWKINEGTLCEYVKLVSDKDNKTITEEKFEEEEAKLKLYRWRLSNIDVDEIFFYPLSKYPNPMSLRALLDASELLDAYYRESDIMPPFKDKLLSYYATGDMECSGTQVSNIEVLEKYFVDEVEPLPKFPYYPSFPTKGGVVGET